MDQLHVKSLKDLSLIVVYDVIASSLTRPLSQDNSCNEVTVIPGDEDDSAASSSSSMNQKKKKLLDPADQRVADIRDEYLAGTYGQIRKWILREYCKKKAKGDGGVNPMPDLCHFLDCILDDSFTELECLSYLYPGGDVIDYGGNLQLLTIVIRRCTQLSTLTIPQRLKLDTQELERQLVTSITSLKHLTKLDLSCSLGVSDANLFFTLLGEACPELTHLVIGKGIPFETEQQLNLVLGQRAALYPQYMRDEMWTERNIYYFQFDKNSTTSICKSLKSLRAVASVQGKHADSPIFLLRHIPQLEELDLGGDLLRESLPIFSSLKRNNTVSEDAICHRVSSSSNRLQWATNAPPPRTLNLKKLDDVRELCGLESIVSLCPRLRHLTLSLGFNTVHDNLDSELLVRLSEITSIKFKLVVYTTDFSLRRSILSSSIGEQLVRLELEHCHDFDLADLIPLTQLEELILGEGTAVRSPPHPTDVVVEADLFLPRLKKMTSTKCLGTCWGKVFECKRPTLIELHLSCFHIGFYQEGNDLTWEDLPKLWSNLRHLSVNSPNPGLTVEKLSEIVPQFQHLTKLQLSKFMLRQAKDKQMAWDLTDELEKRATTLEFTNANASSSCHVVPPTNTGTSYRAQGLSRIRLQRGMSRRALARSRRPGMVDDAHRQLRESLLEIRRLPSFPVD